MTELQQGFIDNLLSDTLLSLLLVGISVYGLYRLAKFWRISVLPFLVLLPSFVVAGLILYVPVSPLYVRSDGEFYQHWGFSLASAWLSGNPTESPQALWPGKGLWPLTIAAFSVLAGPVTITLIVFNALILVLTAVLLQKATSLLGGMSPRWSVVVVFLSSSPFLLWGPSLLREAMFWLGVALGVLAVSYASVRRHRPVLLSVGLSALVLLGIRPDAGLVLVYGFVAMVIILLGVVGYRRSLPRVAITSFVLILLVLSFPTTFDFVREGTTAQSILDSNKALAAEDVTTAFGSSISREAEVTSSGEAEVTSSGEAEGTSSGEADYCDRGSSEQTLGLAVLCRAAVNLPYTLFGPFHWEYEPSPIWLIAGASTLHFLVLVGLAVYYVLVSEGRRWPLLAVLAVALASMVMFSSVLTNYGILIRFRAATEIMLVPLAILGGLSLSLRIKSARSRTLENG